jgi:hypothetical protein
MEYKPWINTVLPDLIRYRLPLYETPGLPAKNTPHPDCRPLRGEGRGEGIDDRISMVVIFFALSLIIFGFVVESGLTEFSYRMFTE